MEALALIRGLVLEALYPSRANCMGCGSPAGVDEGWLCEACARLLMPIAGIPGPRCPRCGRPLDGAPKCETCGDWPDGFLSAARFVYPYRKPIKGMIRHMKYQGVARMADWMAEKMLDVVRRELPGGLDAVVPVPMHKKRLRLRGGNHAAAIAGALALRMDVKYLDALTRVRDTAQQAKLSAGARRRNLEGAFQSTEAVARLRVLLVDDVLTTGATALACARALRAAGAEDVQCIALAGAIDRGLPQKKVNIEA